MKHIPFLIQRTDTILRHYRDNSFWYVEAFDYLKPAIVVSLKAKGRIIARIINIKFKK